MSRAPAPPWLPMEAASVETIPAGESWQYEPKWDGFRCLAVRDRSDVSLWSKSGQPLGRYFPEIVAAVQEIAAERFVLDGELVISVDGRLSFDDLLLRLHPAESRVRKLAAATPAWLIVFDLLASPNDPRLAEKTLEVRRAELEAFAASHLRNHPTLRLSPATDDLAQAKRWFGSAGSDLDGLIAKRKDVPYAAGERDGMVKIKPRRTADCVVGGFRYAEKKKEVGSMLLGLYDDAGKLHHVGFCSGIKEADRAELTRKLESSIEAPGFTGRAPGGPSRWSNQRSAEWKPLKPQWVVEVSFDHVTADRFRHGTRFLRWRPDKATAQCTMDQLRQRASQSLARWLTAPTDPKTARKPTRRRQKSD